MPWEDIYPILTDDLVAEYEANAAGKEKQELASHFTVADIVNRRDTGNVVSTSLFFKSINPERNKFPQLSEHILRHAEAYGLVERHNPWTHYVEPLLAGARRLAKLRPEVTLRVYLAQDMAFLIPKLIEVGCEIYHMTSSSISMQPGMMWRFLALQEEEIEVTIIDGDRGHYAAEDATRTSLLRESGLRYWRLANFYHQTPYSYNPLLGCQFGGIGGRLQIGELAEAFIWHRLAGRLGAVRNPVSGKEVDAYHDWAKWPGYGADEWFATVALFPRMAPDGILTLMGRDVPHAHWNALDIEFCMKNNADSQIVMVETPDAKNREHTGNPNT